MAVNLFGNINGSSYQPPNINLFEMAKKQNNQLKMFHETQNGKNPPIVKVDISEEGLRALHGSKLKGSVDLRESIEDLKFISEHQPIESFTNRFSKAMMNEYLRLSENKQNGSVDIQEKADILLNTFKDICDEICLGHDEGNRIRFKEDSSSEDGFTKLSKEDELSILVSEFKEFVEARFGKKHQEEAVKVAQIVNDLQKVKQEMGCEDIRYYEPEQIPGDFVEKLLNAANQYVKYAKTNTPNA